MITVGLFHLFPTAVTAVDPKSNKNYIQNPYSWAINVKTYVIIHCFLGPGSGKYAFAKQLHKATTSLVSIHPSACTSTPPIQWNS
jgi:hypothetical protein